ncbi:MAG: GNAT family N-acetyltransferase, partial [Candidatus Aenigmarchaeota archaeon]|nr:GNAT family N-acetyltransferase [Candidatus Aenigmarchaeota archaeon]
VCVGTATVTYWKENNTRRDIYSFNINENYRRKGFGKAAVEKLREYERKQGCKKLVLESDRCVVRFWSKCGFEQCCDDNFGSWGIWMYRDI